MLEEVPLFAGLPRRHLRRIAALARLKRFTSGASIARAGTPGDAFYVILDGAVRVVPANGKATKLGQGEFFGEMALLDGAPRSADVSADGEVLTIVIGRAAFASSSGASRRSRSRFCGPSPRASAPPSSCTDQRALTVYAARLSSSVFTTCWSSFHETSGSLLTNSRKSQLGISRHSSGVAAVTVALRSRSAISASSPK